MTTVTEGGRIFEPKTFKTKGTGKNQKKKRRSKRGGKEVIGKQFSFQKKRLIPGNQAVGRQGKMEWEDEAWRGWGRRGDKSLRSE